MKPSQLAENQVIHLSQEVFDRAKSAALQMRKNGEHRTSFKFFSDSVEDNGLISDSSDGMIVLGSFMIEGTSYYTGISVQ